jgi:hypothetical protein
MERWIEKKTGTYAETIEASGLADLLCELGFSNVVVSDEGSEFRIHTASGTPAGNWKASLSAGFPYTWEKSKEPKPALSNVLDYEGEKEKRDTARKAGRSAQAVMESQEIEGIAEARPEINTATILASMRKGWNWDRDLAKWVEAHQEDALKWVRFQLGLGGSRPDGVPPVSNSQVLNPISGKGIHAGKTEIRSAGSIPAQLLDPFSEWMKLRGLWNTMLLYRSGDDFKFFVIEPTDIPVSQIGNIRAELQSLNLWGGIRLDIQATLRCARVLILRSDAVQDTPGSIQLLRRRTRAVISGLRLSYFKSLGTAAALMNDAFLPLPDWFAIENRDDARAYLSIIDEAIERGGCLSSLQEKNSDDGVTLQQFREWLLTGDLTDLLEFRYRFAQHLMQRLGRKEWARPFGTENLSMLLTKAYEEESHVTEIIEDAGFQSVARALRNATVYALTLPNLNREVRFGIAQKWKQKMKSGAEELATAIAEFVQDYNWETVHRLKGKGHLVSTEELDSLMHLIQNRPADLVGSLLLAYGYSRAPKVQAGQSQEAESQA